jgi:uncharacterized phiE125 gp8 family phage protein
MKSNKLITPPTVEPVSLEEMKTHARIDDDGENTLLQALIVAARQWIEKSLSRALINQIYEFALDQCPNADSLLLPVGPVQSVIKIESFDDDDTASLMPEMSYLLDGVSAPARVILRKNAQWPDTTRSARGLIVTYSAGYGPDASFVPEPLKLAIMQLALHWYEHRGEAVAGSAIQMTPMGVMSLLLPYRFAGLGAL